MVTGRALVLGQQRRLGLGSVGRNGGGLELLWIR